MNYQPIHKKLLILGATTNEIDVVKIAQKMGCYVIVTDSHEDWKHSPAKYTANEAWNISWSNISELEVQCRKAGIDGVIAGFSEFRVENMIKLCEVLNLPCYITREQLEITRDKKKFKTLCRQFNIKTVKEYSMEDNGKKKFPLIIKPVDRAGSIGINVAYNEKDYETYLKQALELSPSKNVIIEEYIDNGIKFDCMYEMHYGKINYIGSCDTIRLSPDKGKEVLQKAWVWPSRFSNLFREKHDHTFRKMLKEGIGMANGYCDISCFYRDGEFLVFEAGFRLTGEHSFDYQYKKQGRNHIETIINYAINQPISDTIHDCGKDLKSIIYNIYFMCPKGETLDTIIGIDSLKINEHIITIVQQQSNGFSFENNIPVNLLMINVCSKDINIIKSNINNINESIKVLTVSGKIYNPYLILSTDEINSAFNNSAL